MTISHSTYNSFVIPEQNFYIRDDDTSPEGMGITLKAGKMDTQFGFADAFTTTLPAGQQPDLSRIS